MKIPRWAKIVLVLVAVVVVLALAIPPFLNVDRYRPDIVKAIEENTGRKASIGKINARLLPRVGFVIENFALSNPEGFGGENLLSVEAIKGTLQWMPLFSGEFQISGVELVKPRIFLLVDERGKANYDFETPKKTAKAPAASEESFKISDIDSIEITDLELTVGQVTGRKKTVIPSLRARGINAELSDIALDEKRLKQWKAESNLKGATIEVPGLRGPLTFKSGDFKLRDGAAESAFEVEVAKAADIDGKLKMPNIEEPVVNFEMHTELLDLDQLAAASTKAGEPAPAAPAQQKSKLIAQGKVSADRIRYAPYEATQAKADVKIYTDKIEAPLTMLLYGGSLGVNSRLDRRQSPERFSSNIEVKKLDVAKVMAVSPETRQKMTGTADLTMQIFGSLGPNLMNSLSGTGNMAIRDGKLPGVNMSGAMANLAKLQNVLTFGQGSAQAFGGETPFNSITADLRIANARVHSDRIHLDAPSGTVDLRGSLGFDQTLSYDGQAVMMGGESGTAAKNPAQAITGILGGVMKQTVGRLSVPFALRGTIASPKIQPGRGLPGISTGSQTQTQTQQQQEPAKKKSIFDVFRKP